jgi:uncharacterized membrane protein
MDWLTIAFRIVHILSGVIWVGGTALFFFYVEPTVTKLGPDAAKFMDEVINKRKAPIYFVVASTLTVLAGVLLYWQNSGGFSNAWPTTRPGIAFGLGGLAAIIAWVSGGVLIPRGVQAVTAIGGEIQAAGGPPSADLMGRMHAAQERLRTVGLVDLVLVLFAVIAMATARYL